MELITQMYSPTRLTKESVGLNKKPSGSMRGMPTASILRDTITSSLSSSLSDSRRFTDSSKKSRAVETYSGELVVICECCGYSANSKEFVTEDGDMVCPQCGNIIED